jgi:molybdopterin-guanine dinucleotide biosynthesis protein B
MAGARLISIVGRKDAGKTSLTVALAAEFVRRGRRVMTIKHGHHRPHVDVEGTDSWRHFHEGKAERVLLAGPDGRILFDRAPDTYDPIALARQFLADADIILVEGFKRAPIPKVEVWRKAVSPAPLWDPAFPDAGRWVAMITDDDGPRDYPFQLLRFRDTMWLHFLASLAWDEALILEP